MKESVFKTPKYTAHFAGKLDTKCEDGTMLQFTQSELQQLQHLIKRELKYAQIDVRLRLAQVTQDAYTKDRYQKLIELQQKVKKFVKQAD